MSDNSVPSTTLPTLQNTWKFLHVLSHSPTLTLAPSETLKFILWPIFLNYVQVLPLVTVWVRVQLGDCCFGCGCGPAAQLWHSGWIWAQSSVGWGFVPLPVMIWWSSDAALTWPDLGCSNAPHTPSSRCEADAVIQHLRALHFSCAIGFSVSCVQLAGHKVWNMTCPIPISPINGDRAGKCAAPQWKPQNSEDLSDLVLPRMCLDSDSLGCPRFILRRSAVQSFLSLLLELLLSSGSQSL